MHLRGPVQLLLLELRLSGGADWFCMCPTIRDMVRRSCNQVHVSEPDGCLLQWVARTMPSSARLSELTDPTLGCPTGIITSAAASFMIEGGSPWYCFLAMPFMQRALIGVCFTGALGLIGSFCRLLQISCLFSR